MESPNGGNKQPVAPLVWLDMETTGLSPHRDRVLELGMVATDGNLERFEGIPDLQIVIIPSDGLDITKLPAPVVEMHAKSGLLAEIAAGKGCQLSAAQQQVRNWLRHAQRVIYNALPSGVTGTMSYSDCKFLMAGSTVGQFDRQFFIRIDPHPSLLEEFFEYRVLDVSSYKEGIKRWFGEEALYLSPEEKPHRVIPDIEHSIAELAFYRKRYFVEPGVLKGAPRP